MNKIKINTILASISLLFGFFAVQGGAALAVADPGCYAKTATGVVKTACPDDATTKLTQSPTNQCFITSASGQTATPFEKADCQNITVSSSTTEPATTSACPVTTDGSAAGELGCAPAGENTAKHVCGRGDGNEVKVAFDFGCIGGDRSKYTGDTLNPIIDIAFALFRFLSAGVGLVVIGSIIIAGIQYTASRGEPQATGAAIHRVTNSLIALLIFIFMFAIANFLVPGGMFL